MAPTSTNNTKCIIWIKPPTSGRWRKWLEFSDWLTAPILETAAPRTRTCSRLWFVNSKCHKPGFNVTDLTFMLSWQKRTKHLGSYDASVSLYEVFWLFEIASNEQYLMVYPKHILLLKNTSEAIKAQCITATSEEQRGNRCRQIIYFHTHSCRKNVMYIAEMSCAYTTTLRAIWLPKGGGWAVLI